MVKPRDYLHLYINRLILSQKITVDNTYTQYSVEDFVSDESFVRYFFNENEEDIFFWEEWIVMHPEKMKDIEDARKLLDIFSPRLPQQEFDQVMELIKNHIFDCPPLNEPAVRVSLIENSAPIKHKVNKLFSWRAAAVLLILAIFGIVPFLVKDTFVDHPILNADSEWAIKSNPKGQKSHFHLPDGSFITLNSGSEVKFLQDFSKHIRKIELKGEAFFEVAHDPLRPFIVKTDKMSIKALGTSFNVRAFDEIETVEVSLVTGKVEVNITEAQSNGNTSILIPGEGLILNKENGRVTKEKFDPELSLTWQRGVLYFKDASLEHVVTTIERWYNVGLEIKNRPTKENLYTGQFDNQSLELVLESLSFSKNFKYKIDGKNIIIDFPTSL